LAGGRLGHPLLLLSWPTALPVLDDVVVLDNGPLFVVPSGRPGATVEVVPNDTVVSVVDTPLGAPHEVRANTSTTATIAAAAMT
jgi:hypothetical protein